jgi:hypothetical protein
MIEVNTKTLTATREPIPTALQGLSQDTLRNLQMELNPVPVEFLDIEFWDEVDVTPAYNPSTHTLDGEETLLVNSTNKTVEVTRGVRAKTTEELEAERKALVPRTITPRQARLALLQATLLDEVEAMVAADKSMSIWWEYSLEIERNSEHIINAGLALGLSEEQLDNLFIEGSKL